MSNTKKLFWDSPTHHFIYQRWAMLVLLNAALPFIFSLTIIAGNPSKLTGVILAVVSFLVIYAELESWLLLNGYIQLAKQLKLAALIKVATIILPFIDIVIGAFALGLTHFITGINIEKVTAYDSHFINLPMLAASYITTMIDGFALSLIIAFLIMIIKSITQLRQPNNGIH